MPSANMLAAAACFRTQRILGSTVPSITECGRPKLDTQPLGITPTAACTRKQHALSSNSSKQQYSRQQCAFSTPCEQKITTRPWQYANTSVLPETVCPRQQRLSGNAVPLATTCPRQHRASGNSVPSAAMCLRQHGVDPQTTKSHWQYTNSNEPSAATCSWQQCAFSNSALGNSTPSATKVSTKTCFRQQCS